MHFISGVLRRKRKKPVLLSEKITEKLSYLKYLVLTVIAVLCFAGIYGKAKGTSPWDVFFYAACRKFPFAGIFAGSDITTSYYCGDVSGRKIFLSESVSDGSSILIASGASVLCIAPRQRKLHQRLQRMHEEMSIRDRTPGRRITQSRGRLFPMPEMY